MRAVGYLRVSTEEQAKEGVSLAAQRRRIEAWAVAHDSEVAAVFEDDGLSGSLGPERRPGLAAALAMLKRGEANCLVVLKLDRLFRRTRGVLDLVDLSERHRWSLCSVSESLDTKSASGRMVVTVLAAFAQMERDLAAERTVMAFDELRKQGRATSRFTSWGLRTADGAFEVSKGERRKLQACEAEVAILELVLVLRSQGLGARRIAGALNTRQISNPRTGRVWTKRQAETLIHAAGGRA